MIDGLSYPQYCKFLRNGDCYQSYREIREDNMSTRKLGGGNGVPGTEQWVRMGVCPFPQDLEQQKWCCMSDPTEDVGQP